MRPLPLLLLAALVLGACGSDPDPALGTATTEYASADRVVPTSTVTVDYVGTLADGTEFDAGSGATFPLGGVVPGFRDGLIGMERGETRTFTVAPEDGYGAAGAPPTIPPNAALTFRVTVHEIQ